MDWEVLTLISPPHYNLLHLTSVVMKKKVQRIILFQLAEVVSLLVWPSLARRVAAFYFSHPPVQQQHDTCSDETAADRNVNAYPEKHLYRLENLTNIVQIGEF